MKPFAFVFPGQGSQSVGMLDAWGDHPAVGSTLDEASQALGEDVAKLIAAGPRERLDLTTNTQPAMLAAAVACYRAWVHEGGPAPSAVAGHSLGEYSAHVAAGSLTYADALRLVRRRGELMAVAGDQNAGTMAAILGLDGALVEAACAEASAEGKGAVVAANFNSPGQVVISGAVDAVEIAMALCKEKGAKRALRLPVAGAFHSPLMGPATEGLVDALAQVPVRDAAIPVIANVDAQPVTRAADITDRLGRQLLGAVRWEESMRALVGLGVTGFIELGSGRVLRGLLKSITPESRSANVDDPASLEETLAAFGQEARA